MEMENLKQAEDKMESLKVKFMEAVIYFSRKIKKFNPAYSLSMYEMSDIPKNGEYVAFLSNCDEYLEHISYESLDEDDFNRFVNEFNHEYEKEYDVESHFENHIFNIRSFIKFVVKCLQNYTWVEDGFLLTRQHVSLKNYKKMGHRSLVYCYSYMMKNSSCYSDSLSKYLLQNTEILNKIVNKIYEY